jgi:hypothetical protein
MTINQGFVTLVLANPVGGAPLLDYSRQGKHHAG